MKNGISVHEEEEISENLQVCAAFEVSRVMATVNEEQHQEESQQTQSVTQLEFHQAMRDFKTMFPEMDEDVIEVVLRANSGAVDATIDQLLAMSTDNENERLRTELDATENDEVPPCYSPATPPPSYQQAVPYAQSPAHSPAAVIDQSSTATINSSPTIPRRPQQVQPRSQLSKSFLQPYVSQTLPLPKRTSEKSNQKIEKPNVPLKILRNWQPPLLGPLPSRFLRLEEMKHPMKYGLKITNQQVSKGNRNVTVLSSSVLQQRMEENERQRQLSQSTEDPGLSQFLEDERIALFLQNEEFMQELRHNKEFMSTLERASSDDEDDKLKQPPDEMDSFHYSQPIHAIGDDPDAAFREKLRNMGKLSKRKFTQLAKLFSRRKRSGFRQFLGDGTNPSQDNLLLTEDNNSEISEEDSDNNLRKDDTWNSHVGGDDGTMGTMDHKKDDVHKL
ncbi:CUE domain-containing protein 1-like [Limulus polyphemus]|uniref:CUE domain-containing protein 1-like n=1 Tax=Limulus polyphemus TaxID=6850 RepID=A0ABM1TFE0_LIMPO|nr:CUE domain-containing protein 1-like [Limulus polyphemus]